jgi:hypothetical protein
MFLMTHTRKMMGLKSGDQDREEKNGDVKIWMADSEYEAREKRCRRSFYSWVMKR